MKLWHFGVAAALILLAGIVWLVRAVDAQRPRGSDADQIRALVSRGLKAAERRDATTLGQLVSNDYKDSFGFRAETVRRQASAIIGRARQVTISVPGDQEVIQVEPGGRQGSVIFPIGFQAAGGDAPYSFQGTLTLRLAKEPVRYYLVFPGEEWRVVAVEGYSPDFSQ
jgi:hypothetical protein